MMPINFLQAVIAFCFFLPVFIIFYCHLYRHTGILALVVHCLLLMMRCLGGNSLSSLFETNDTWNLLFNFIDVPLLLLALLAFCPATKHRQRLRRLLRDFVLYEMLVLVAFGLTPTASLYVTISGLLIATLYTIFLFLRQLKFTLLYHKNGGRVLMLGALAFLSGSYLLLFCAGFVLRISDVAAIHTIYFASSGIAAVVLSIGLFMMRRRIKELQDVKIARHEMRLVFGN